MVLFFLLVKPRISVADMEFVRNAERSNVAANGAQQNFCFPRCSFLMYRLFKPLSEATSLIALKSGAHGLCKLHLS